MTEDLLHRLRYNCELAQNLGAEASILLQAADVRTTLDRIEAQAAEIEKLREALDYAQQAFLVYVQNERPNRYTMTFKILADKCRKALEQST